MLRTISCIYIEGQALSRKDVFKVFRMCAHSSSVKSDQPTRKLKKYRTTVLSQDVKASQRETRSSGAPPLPPPPPPPPPPRSKRAFTLITALTFTASLGGVYLYRRMAKEGDDEAPDKSTGVAEAAAPAGGEEEPPYPGSGEELPRKVQYLLVGGGTASFAAMRAIRSARPDARVLLVADERALPYMRPPLSKELWREPDLAAHASRPHHLTFRQWNGRRRSVLYEPEAFYAPMSALAEGEGAGGAGGAGVARGWRVTRLDVERRTAELTAGDRTATVEFDRALVATGVRPRRLGALREAAAAGRALALRSLRDAGRMARALDDERTRTVAVVGAGLLGTELAASLADRLRDSGKRVVLVYRGAAPLESMLPPYLAAHAARTLADLGVTLLPHAEIASSEVQEERVRLQLTSGAQLDAELVVEAVGAEPDDELARRSQLETHPALGGVVVNAELQARAAVWAAGDAACFHDPALGRRRVEHHDHAVLSGRLAGENMAAVKEPRAYRHQSMFWSDLGPGLGYEAIGIIDSSLQTVGVFSEVAVTDAAQAKLARVDAASADSDSIQSEDGAAGALLAVGAGGAGGAAAGGAAGDPAGGKRYERGVVFYVRERRVVGVLLWNLFNRMHVARQVLAQGEFDDLFEVAKLFALHEED